MARLECSREYIGAVAHPGTGERVQLDEDHPEGVVELLADEYHYLTPVIEDSDAVFCGVNGCSREVESVDETCWQHP